MHAPSFWPPRLSPVLRFTAFVAAPAICLAAALVLFGTWSLWATTNQVDESIRKRQANDVQLALGAVLDDLAQSQAGVAIWDPAYAEAQKARPDAEWLDKNVGTWLNYVFHHEFDIIIDGQDRPVYAMRDGERVAPAIFSRVRSALLPLIQAARGSLRRAPNTHERLPNQKLAQNSTVRTSPAAFHATDLVKVSGRAAAASVMRMIPDAKLVVGPAGRQPMLVSIRFLDGKLMEDLSRVRGIRDARVLPASALSKTGIYSVPLRSSRGVLLGHLGWRPDMPGRDILRSIAKRGGGAAAALIALLAALIFVVGRLMFRDARSIGALEAARVELQAKEARAQYLANHDVLTSLPNRAAFNRFVDGSAGNIAQQALGVLLIDLDKFKHVNDTLGHLAGDQLIQSVAGRLSARLPRSGLLARLGGDEFAICLTEDLEAESLRTLAEACLAELRKPFPILGSEVQIGGSIGIAMGTPRSSDRNELLRKADIAMYSVKGSGRDGYRFFTAEMDESLANRRALEADLRMALSVQQQLFVAYQPKMDASGATVVGLEALVRWDHPGKGLLTPDLFIPIAEEAGLIHALGSWVLAEACRVSKMWPSLTMAVNVSPVQFKAKGFAASIRSIVQTWGVDPRNIELEVTEGILIDDAEEVRAALHDLRDAGFRIALDDFGTGYSSLSYLKQFKVDRIKIDKSFVKRLGRDQEAIAIVQAVIALGHAMNLSVTAEGVETMEQGSLLRTIGCDELQGYLFSKALREEELSIAFDSIPNAAIGGLRAG
jgi:diguanylate cyclase (GGDEF)-like protein